MSDDTKLPLTSDNPSEALLAQLRELAPHLFSEGKVDWDKLKATLGEAIETGPERYGLTWAGKSEAFRNVQTASVGTLLPMPEESVNFDTSENLIIEGDNLEVLKLLQKSYHGKVKMIYIDPPYNTGNEFIYPDNYREGLDDYLRYSGQVSEEGQKQSTNTETSGRFHSKWLNMMYPRLFLARNLLRGDGVIFVSIDDNEVHNLRMLMNEVFGEENFVASVIWQKKYSTKADSKYFSESHEYLLVFSRNISELRLGGLKRTSDQESIYKNPDNDPRGPWASDNLLRTEEREYAVFAIVGPNGKEYWPPKGSSWRFNKDKIQSLITDNRIWFGERGDAKPRLKRFRADVRETIPAQTLWTFDQVGHTDEGTKGLAALFGGTESPFPNPKPPRLIARAIAIGCPCDGVVLDFFGGSGTTAHATFEQCAQDGINRQFILVQLPEKTDKSEYPTIAHITRERVRRVINKLNEADATKLDLEGRSKENRGFRAFKLASSNFKIWEPNQASTTPEELAEQLQLYADNLQSQRSQDDILFEFILKAGLPLSSKIEQVQIGGKQVYAIADGQLLICLENPISEALLRGMMAQSPLQILCLDTAFQGNDPLKTNTVLEAKSHGILFRTV